METSKFTPNAQNVQKRAEIQPFGRAKMYERVEPVVVEFKLNSQESEVELAPRETGIKSETGAYVPPVLNTANFKPTFSEVTVRVTNIPLHMTHRELYDLFTARCGKIFSRCNLVTDKETKVSKGVAYVGCDSMENAALFAKGAMNIVVDSFKFAVEILESR